MITLKDFKTILFKDLAFAAKLRCHHQSVCVTGRVNVLIRLD